MYHPYRDLRDSEIRRLAAQSKPIFVTAHQLSLTRLTAVADEEASCRHLIFEFSIWNVTVKHAPGGGLSSPDAVRCLTVAWGPVLGPGRAETGRRIRPPFLVL